MTAPLRHPWVDDRAAPLYVWKPSAEPSSEELAEALADIQRWMPSLDSPYGWITDPRRMRIQVVASHRKQLGDHLKIIAPYAQKWCAGMATIASNPAIRGAGTAIGWLAPYSFPVHWCADLDEAWEWARQRLLEHDVIVPTHPPREKLAGGSP